MRLLSLLLFVVLAIGSPFVAEGQMLDVRIEPFDRLAKMTYQVMADEVAVLTTDSFPRVIVRLNLLDQIEILNEDEGVEIRVAGKSIGIFPSVLLWGNDHTPKFKVHSTKSRDPFKTYPGHLLVRPGARGVDLINRVHLEDYTACVIHAEAGHHQTLDFFKVQALSARTYALRSMGRHRNSGYDVCDNTHCQAYKGTYRPLPLLDQAVTETRDEVIVHDTTHLIEAVFSANCGGFTANSEDVWVANVEYLRAVPDYDHCEGFANHAWHVTIPKLDFLAKLGRYFKVEATRFEVIPDQSGRVKRIQVNDDPKLTISGEEVRRLFKTKSSKFLIFDANNLLFIEGYGFGHGVGMCQDGAYYLSKSGMGYMDIIRHYYKGVDVMNLDVLHRKPGQAAAAD